jgi:hypothetical protein
LDKAYGTPEKFKEFIDLCHQNGIAVILDIAFNHATGRSPLVRLWNVDPDGDGYGDVAANPTLIPFRNIHIMYLMISIIQVFQLNITLKDVCNSG